MSLRIMHVCYSFVSVILHRPCIKVLVYHRYIDAYNMEVLTGNVLSCIEPLLRLFKNILPYLV